MTRVAVCVALMLHVGAPGIGAQSSQDLLWDAAMRGDTAGIRIAVAAGARVDSLDRRTSANGRYALNWAAWHNQAPALLLLLQLGADIDAGNITGFTALHHAAENGSLEAARALLKAGADFAKLTNGGATAEEVAASRDMAALTQLLVDARNGKLPDE